MLLRIAGVVVLLGAALGGLNSGHLRAELQTVRYDLHRLRHHFAPTSSQPSYVAYSLPANTPDRVVVDTSKVQHTLSPDFFGINYVGFWDQAQGSRASARALGQTAIRTVRFPGGAPADWYDWQDPYYKGWSSTSPQQLWTYTRSFGGRQVIFGTNVQGNVPPPPGKSYAANSPQNAAAWAAYNAQTHIPALMEVGNEEDLNLLKSQNDPNYTKYIDAFNAQAKAMHEANPKVQVLGPVGANEWYWWGLNELGTFLQQTGNRTGTGQVDGVALHFYKGNSWLDGKGVAQYWLSPTGPWAAIQQMMRAHDTRRLPVYITEWNVGGSTSNNAFVPTLGHALTIADMLGAFAVSGVAGEDYFDLHGGTSYGLLYGPGESRPLDTPTPTYYAMALWKHMGNRIVSLQQSEDPASVMSAYATTQQSGAVQVLLINKHPTARTVQLRFQRATPAGRQLQAYSLRSTDGNVDGLNANYDGVTMPSPQQRLPGPQNMGIVHGSTISYKVPGYSAVVLSLSRLSRSVQTHWAPIPTATPLPAFAVKLSGHVTATSLQGGDRQTLTLQAQANDDADGLLADFEVYDGSGTKVFQATPTITLKANQVQTFSVLYHLPQTAYGGSYTFKAGIFGPGWSPTYAWLANAGTFTVSGPSRPTITATGSVASGTTTAGGAVTATAVVKAANNSLPNALVDFEIYGAAGTKICQTTKDNVTVPQDGSVTVTGQCPIPRSQASTKATLKIGVFGPNWSPLYAWNSNAGTFTISAAS